MEEKRYINFFNFEYNESRLAYFLILPIFIVVLGMFIFPLLYSLFISFTDMRLTSISEFNFIGLDNFIKAFNDSVFINSLAVTGQFVFFSITLKFVFGILIALALKEKFKGRSIVRSLIIVPWATPFIVSGIIWRWLYNPSAGFINYFLKKIGLITSNMNWLSDKNLAMPSIIITDLWQGTPFFVIILLAGLQTIPEDIYDAAAIDGSNSFQKFFFITLPLIKYPIFIVGILGTIFSLNQFDLFYIMTRGGPADYTRVATLYDWQIAFKSFEISYASAISYIIMIISFIITIAYIIFLTRGEE